MLLTRAQAYCRGSDPGKAARALRLTPDSRLLVARDDAFVEPANAHRHLCTIELIAEGHAERCPGEGCPFWQRGCVLVRVEEALDGRPEVASLLLDLRRKLEAGQDVPVDPVRAQFEHLLFP